VRKIENPPLYFAKHYSSKESTTMLTRSKMIASRLAHCGIDFDDASKEWLANKKRVGHMYVYICGCSLKNGIDTCQRKSSAASIDGYCVQHAKLYASR
jgi:hypothetical protein